MGSYLMELLIFLPLSFMLTWQNIVRLSCSISQGQTADHPHLIIIIIKSLISSSIFAILTNEDG